MGGRLAAGFQLTKIILSTLGSSESCRSREDTTSIYTPCQVRPSEAGTMAKLVPVSLSEQRSIIQYQKSVRSMQTRALLCLTDSGHLKLPTVTMLINWIKKECLMQFAWRPHYLRVFLLSPFCQLEYQCNTRKDIAAACRLRMQPTQACSSMVRACIRACTHHLRRKFSFQPRAAASEVTQMCD